MRVHVTAYKLNPTPSGLLLLGFAAQYGMSVAGASLKMQRAKSIGLEPGCYREVL
jgi:hypothetical protein